MNELEFTRETATPRWAKDLLRFLPVKAQFVLSGNIRDYYPFPRGDAASEDLAATQPQPQSEAPPCKPAPPQDPELGHQIGQSGICSICGCTSEAIGHFGWHCRQTERQ